MRCIGSMSARRPTEVDWRTSLDESDGTETGATLMVTTGDSPNIGDSDGRASAERMNLDSYFRPMSWAASAGGCSPRSTAAQFVLSADSASRPDVYDGVMPLPSAVRSYLDEPAVADAPTRVWRDWALVAAATLSAVLEAVLRTDDDWTALSPGWQIASLVVFLLTVPTLLVRRTRPLLATAVGFGAITAYTLAIVYFQDVASGLMTMAVLLVNLYALFRWGSGRQGLWGAAMAVATAIVCNLVDPTLPLSDWIGGFVVLSIPMQLGLAVRYQRSARDRAVSQAKSFEREELARELHDSVAHHVSAIAVQAQAGQAMAATDPARALEVLAVIEEAASRTLTDMRAMVGTLRSGRDADLAPQRGIGDLRRLADDVSSDLEIHVCPLDDEQLESIASGVQSAIYRIARESVTNAIRHAARASRIDVAVTVTPHLVSLTVDDDGATRADARRSLDVSAASSSAPGASATSGAPRVLSGSHAASPSGPQAGGPPSGYGLLGMAERAELLGGSLRAGPQPSGGWRVVAEFPHSVGAS